MNRSAALASIACVLAAGAASAAPKLAPTAADWRTPDPENVLVIDTNQGRVFAELTPDVAPLSVARVKQLTRQHLYDGLNFFRVIDEFMDQTGDPKNTGEGGSSLPDVPGEFSFRRGAATPFVNVGRADGMEIGFVGPLPAQSKPIALAALTADGKVPAQGLFCSGALGMARAEDPNSANSQFFLMRYNYPSLNGKYTVFGRVIAGQSFVRAIKVGEPVAAPQDKMFKVQLLADMPAATRPTVRVIDTRSAYFTKLVAAAKTAAGDGFNPCDVELAAEVK
jgi:peptidylprolyl isomerase